MIAWDSPSLPNAVTKTTDRWARFRMPNWATGRMRVTGERDETDDQRAYAAGQVLK